MIIRGSAGGHMFHDLSELYGLTLLYTAWKNIALQFIIFLGEIPERLKGADCKSAGSAFVGSNPTLSKMRV